MSNLADVAAAEARRTLGLPGDEAEDVAAASAANDWGNLMAAPAQSGPNVQGGSIATQQQAVSYGAGAQQEGAGMVGSDHASQEYVDRLVEAITALAWFLASTGRIPSREAQAITNIIEGRSRY